MRAAIYARYSSDLQNPRSIDDQMRDCRTRALANGWEIVATYHDAAVSGTTMFRPGVQDLVTAAAEGRFDIVVAEALDRLSRNQGDIEKLRETLAFHEVQIHTLSEGDVTPLHTAFKGLMNAQFVSELGNKIRRGQRGSVANGMIPGSLAYGYKVVKRYDDKGEPIRGLREVDEDKAAIVRRIAREYADGDSPVAIATRLNAEGVPAPGAGRRGCSGKWNVSTILGHRKRKYGILQNEIYVGRYAYNRQRMVKNPLTGKRLPRTNASAEWTWADMPALRIIDDVTWAAVQARIAAAPTGGARAAYNRRPRHLLSGLMRCGACGGAYTIARDKWLGCAAHNSAGTCDNGRQISIDKVTGAVMGVLGTVLDDEEAVARFVARYHQALRRLAEDRARSTRQASQRLREVRAKIAALVAAIEDGGKTAAALVARLTHLESEERDLVAAQTAPPPQPIKLATNAPALFRAKLDDLAAALTRDDDARLRAAQALRQAIARVVLTPLPTRGHFEIEVAIDLIGIYRVLTSRTAWVVAEEGLSPHRTLSLRVQVSGRG